MLAYKFVNWDIKPLESFIDSREYILASKIEAGERLTRKEKTEIMRLMERSGRNSIKLGGWCYPLHNLPTFYVEQYGSVHIQRAPDKTAIRDTTHGKINKITQRD